MSNLCALWNVGDTEMQMSIEEAVKSAMGLYRKRKSEKGEQFRFLKIESFNLYNSESINKKVSEEEKNRCKEEFYAFFAGIKSNKLALVPYILIDNATKYAKPDTPIAVKFNYVNENTDEAATLIEKHGIFAAAVAKKALPDCSIVCISGAEMKNAMVPYLTMIFEQNAAAVGGKMPDDTFYYGA